jgi:hypothetical protein
MPPLASVWTVLAVLGPAAVLGLALSWLARPLDHAPSEDALRLEAMLDKAGEAGPEIVLLGNSLVDMGVDHKQLAKQLGVPAQRVVPQIVPGSRVAAWYAVLKNRVYANDHAPRLVVVGATVAWLLDPSLQTALDRQKLADQLGPEEPLIQEKLFGREGGWAPWQRVQSRRAPLRTALLDGVRDAVLTRVFPEVDGEEALATVFAAEAVDDRGEERRVIPVVEVERRPRSKPPAARHPADGLVADLVRLAGEQGTRLVFVRMPVPPDRVVDQDVDPEHHRALVQLVNEAEHAAWLDLSDLELRQGDFADWIHLGSSGRRKLTAALGAALTELETLEDGALPAAAMPEAPPSLTRVGGLELGELELKRMDGRACAWMAIPRDRDVRGLADNLLMKAGLTGRSPFQLRQDGDLLDYEPKHWTIGADECNGRFAHVGPGLQFSPRADGPIEPEATPSGTFTAELIPDAVLPVEPEGEAVWLVPGGRLEVAVEGAEAGTALVLGVARGGGEGQPVLRIDGQEAALVPGPGGLVRATLPVAEGPLALTLETPENGPFVLLLELGLQGAGAHRSLLGASAGDRRSFRFFGGSVRKGLVAQFGAPPELPTPAPVAQRGKAARFNGPKSLLAELAALRTELGRYEASPLRVFEDGVQLTGSNKVCAAVVEQGEGRICHNDRFALFSSSDGSSPLSNGRRYTLGLAPERVDRFDLWLYPGDRGAVSLPPKGLQAVPWGASRLDLAALVAPERETILELRLVVDGAAVLEEQWALGPGQQERSFRLPPGLPARPESVSLELATAAEGPAVVLRSVVLRRDPLDHGAG